MGWMDKAKKLAEQAQEKLDEAQQNFNKGGSTPGQAGGASYDAHGRPIQEDAPQAPPAGEAPPPSAEPAPPAPATPAAGEPSVPAEPDPAAASAATEPTAPEPPPADGSSANATPDPFKPLQQ